MLKPPKPPPPLYTPLWFLSHLEICSHEFHQPQRSFRLSQLRIFAQAVHTISISSKLAESTHSISYPGSSSVNGLCYELWKSRKNHFTTVIFMNLIKISTILMNLILKKGFCGVILMNPIKILEVWYVFPALRNTGMLGVLGRL